MAERDQHQIRRACTRFVPGHYQQTPQQTFAALAEYSDPDLPSDFYGEGRLIEDFEAQIADLLGKPAAAFFPSGTMAQQIALRIWADRSGIRTIAMHPTCHLEFHEQQGYRLLHDLRGVMVGGLTKMVTLEELKTISEPLGALLLELPQREMGGVLPTWDELVAIIDWARAQQIIMHLDGERLWECQPFYGREYAAIADLFDTVYVSFYKILGGLAGAALAGPEDIIDQARLWRWRHGGRLIHMSPYVLTAQMGLETRLKRIPEYHTKAVELAEALDEFPEIEIRPNPPHTNMMKVFIRGCREHLLETALDIATEVLIWLPGLLREENLVPGCAEMELTIGDAALDIPTSEIAALYREWLDRAQQAGDSGS
ncbi:MAG: hypothetical protein GYB65_04265 [Chloroflexi bacterium]|nr:hypothetical protein [Chloroflexota bacterium]